MDRREMRTDAADVQDRPGGLDGRRAAVGCAGACSVISENQQTGNNGRTVPATCQTHRGCKGFCNLRLTKVDGEIVFDPHVAGCCVISLDENEARTVRDTLTEWLG